MQVRVKDRLNLCHEQGDEETNQFFLVAFPLASEPAHHHLFLGTYLMPTRGLVLWICLSCVLKASLMYREAYLSNKKRVCVWDFTMMFFNPARFALQPTDSNKEFSD